MHDTVAANPDRYLHPSPALAALLGEARSSGKQLFLLTNSALGFVEQGMRFLVGREWCVYASPCALSLCYRP